MGAFRAELARALRLMFLLTIPSTIGLMMLAEPIMSVLYQHGRFDAHQAAQAGGALRFYAIGLAGYAALKVLVNAFYALDRRKTPMIVSFLRGRLSIWLFNWIFTFRLGWGHRGLAFSTGCVATMQFLAPVRLDAAASGRSRVAQDARHARQDRGWPARRSRRSAPPRRAGCWPTGPRRRSGANRSRCSRPLPRRGRVRLCAAPRCSR